MKRFFFLILFLLVFAVPAFATDISVQATTLTWNATQTTNLQLWICSSDSWTDIDGNLHGPSSPDNRTFTFRVTGLTYNSSTQGLTIPAYSIPPTRNAIRGNSVQLFFWVVQVNGSSVVKLKLLPGTENGIQIPATITSASGCSPTNLCATYADLIAYNTPAPSLPPATYPTYDDMTRAISAAITGTGAAPILSPFVLTQPTSGLDNAQTLSTLSTGLLKVTTASGLLSTAVAATDYQVPISATAPITFTSNTVAMPAATTSVSGYLTSTDWTTFNAKQAALGYTAENLANKNATNGYAGLSSGKVANSQISEVLAPADLTGVSGVQGTGATIPIGTFSALANGQGIVWDSGTSNFINATIGSVTSIAMTVPSGFTVTGSPITGSGTLAISFTSGQTANSFLATPDGTTGALSLRTLVNGDLPTVNAAHGGTGLSSYTAHSILAAGTTGTGNFQQIAPATAGLVLTANGAGVLPSFQSLPAAASHHLLGGSHDDTTASSPPARGSIITAQNSGTAFWAEKVKGTQYQTVQATATDTVFDAVHLDQAAAVTGTLPVASGGTGAATFTANAVLYGNGTGAVQSVLGGAGTLCLQSVDGAAPVFGACSGSAATAWSSLTAPGANLTVAMSTRSTTFTWGTGLAADAFTMQDTTGSTSTNHILLVSSVGTSTMKPVAFTAQGTANGVEMSAAGVLAPIGTGGITANALTGVSGNGIQTRTSAGTFTSRTLTAGVGITVSNGDGVSGNPTITGDLSTLVANQTLWDGANTPRTLTFAVTGTDPVMSFAASSIDVTTGTLKQGGTPVVLESRTLTNGTGINTLGDLSANRTVSIDQSFAATWTGVHTFTPGARSSGVAPYLTVNAPADTNLTLDTEAIGVSFVGATRQHADGTTQATQREIVFAKPTYSAAGTSVITDAATVAITGAPAAGSNMTLTRAHALWIQGGPLTIGAATTNFWLDSHPTVAINRLNDRVMIGGATTNSGLFTGGTLDWMETLVSNTTKLSQVAVLNTIGTIGVLGASRASDLGAASGGVIGLMGFVKNDDATFGSSAYGAYLEAWHLTSALHTVGFELDIVNKAATAGAVVPFSMFPSNLAAGAWVASGGGRSGATNASVALAFVNNGARFDRGLVMGATSLTGTDGTGTGSAPAVVMARGHQVLWINSDASTRATLDSDSFVMGLGSSIGLKGATSGTVTQNVAAAAGTWSFTWPTTAGTANYALTTNGSGVSTWSHISSAVGSPMHGTTVANGATVFGGIWEPGATNAADVFQVVMPFAGTAQNLYVHTQSAQSAGGTFVITVMKNSVATALVVTISAGAASNVFTDTSNSFAFNAGDRLSVKYVNNGSAASAQLTSVAFEIHP